MQILLWPHLRHQPCSKRHNLGIVGGFQRSGQDNRTVNHLNASAVACFILAGLCVFEPLRAGKGSGERGERGGGERGEYAGTTIERRRC